MRTIAIYYSLPANNAYTRHAVDYFTLRDKPLPNRANCELAPNDFAERAFVQHNKFERLVKKQFHHNSTDRRQSNVKPKSTHETRHNPIETALIGDFIGDFDAVQQSAFVAPGPYLHNWHAQLQNPGGNITTHTTHARVITFLFCTRYARQHGCSTNLQCISKHRPRIEIQTYQYQSGRNNHQATGCWFRIAFSVLTSFHSDFSRMLATNRGHVMNVRCKSKDCMSRRYKLLVKSKCFRMNNISITLGLQ